MNAARPLVLLAALTLSSCARVNVTDDVEGRGARGLRVPYARAVVLPALLEGDRVIASRVAWIPDTREGVRVRQEPGLGEGGFSVSLLEGDELRGYLVRYRQRATDARLPETVAGLGEVGAALLAGAALGASGK